MAVTSLKFLGPPDGLVIPDTIVRPALTSYWEGGTGPFDVEYTWDDDRSFANGNGNRQIRTFNSVTSPHTGGPTADLADLTVPWYLRVINTDTGVLQNEIWSIDHDHTGGTFDLGLDASSAINIPWDETNANLKTAIETLTGITTVTVTGTTGDWTVEVTSPGDTNLNQITIDDTNLTGGTTATTGTDSEGNDGIASHDIDIDYFAVNPNTRVHLGLIENVGVGFDDTDAPGGGWGTGGTVGPDGDIIDFRRYLGFTANVGVGFSKDEPGAGWGPNAPSTDAPDGLNIDFRRYLGLLQNLTSDQPCPFIFTSSRSIVESGDTIIITGQGLVSATSPTADAWDAEVRLYESADFGAAFTVLTIVDYTAGSVEDTITATVPGGVSSGFLAVVHTTTPSCAGSNFIGLTILAVAGDRTAGWWAEVWNLRNSARVIDHLNDAKGGAIEQITDDIGGGAITLPADHRDIADILDRTASPQVQRFVKFYLWGRYAYGFFPDDADSRWADDQKRLTDLSGAGPEQMLHWGKALWADHPSNPSLNRVWQYGSTQNVAAWGSFDPESNHPNGTFESADDDGWEPIGAAQLFATTDEAFEGSYSLRVTADTDEGVESDLSVVGGRDSFVDGRFLDPASSGEEVTFAVVDQDDAVATSQVLALTTPWSPFNLTFTPVEGDSYRLQITITESGVTSRQFYIDSVEVYSDPEIPTLEETACTVDLSRTHVAQGLHSLKVTCDAGGDTGFVGWVGRATINPSTKYRLRIAATGAAGDLVKVAMRIGGTVVSSETALTGPAGTQDIITLEGTASPTDTTVRLAISSKDSAAITFWVDDLTIFPGEPAAPAGEIFSDIHTLMAARGALDFLTLNFTVTDDSAGLPWPEVLSLDVPPDWSAHDLIQYFVGLGYDYLVAPINWIEGGDTGWELSLWGPGNAGNDWTPNADGPAFLPGGGIVAAVPSAKTPSATAIIGEGKAGSWTQATADAATLAALERREDFVYNRELATSATLFRALDKRLSNVVTRGAKGVVKWVGPDADPVPYLDYHILDQIRAHLPADVPWEGLPDATYRVVTTAVSFDLEQIEGESDLGHYSTHRQAVSDSLIARAIERARSADNLTPGTGRVAGSVPQDTVSDIVSDPGVVAPHTHTNEELTGPAGGDLSGAFPNPTVARIRTRDVDSAAPAADDTLIWVAGPDRWTPGAGDGLPWTAPTLLNSWADFGSGHAVAEYRKDHSGMVHVKGLISGGTTTGGTVLFNLPAGFRPAEHQTFAVDSNDAHARIEVQTDGDVVLQAGGSATSLSVALSFLADA